LDHLPYAREVAWSHVTRGEQVADERCDIAGKQALGELANHGMLDVGFGDERAIDELTVTRSPGEDSPALKPGDYSRNGRLRQLPLGVKLLPDLRDGQLALLPEEAKDGGLEVGELLAIGHV
jgi:hypothetical protein